VQTAVAIKWIEAVRMPRSGLLLMMMVALCACARLPPTGAVSIPPIPAGMARVWFYREDMPTETPQRPYVRMNGAVIGISEDGGAFYRDVPPGEYYVTVDSYGVDINQFPRVVLVAGQTVFLQVFGSKSWASVDAAEWERPTFYVWVMPNDVGAPAVARSPFYPSG
jgi:hypothetical protein